MRNIVTLVVAAVVAVLDLQAGVASAQTNEEIFQQFQWNFSTPGARAAGMGQAFIGLADDATATVTNPAGITRLTRPQVYAEYKRIDTHVERLAAVDAIVTQQPTVFGVPVNSVSFLAASAPIGSQVAVGFSRHQFIDYREPFQLAARPIPNSPAGANYFPVDAEVNFNGAQYGATIGTAFSGLRLGATVSVDQLTSDTRNTRFYYQGSGFNATSTGIVVYRNTITGTDTQFSWTIGALYQPYEKLSAGFVYTKGPRFHLNETYQINPSEGAHTAAPLIDVPGWPRLITIHVPDRLGLGVAARPHQRVTVAVDFLRVAYSNLTNDLTVVLNPETVFPSDYIANDATEIHVGGEWAIVTGAQPVFIRSGFVRNPYHGTVFLGTSSSAVNAVQNGLFNVNPRNDDMRMTAGAGFVYAQRVQVDVAYVWAREFIASTAIRF